MNKKKTFLYVSSAIVWVCIVVCSFWHDRGNFSPYQSYEAETKEVTLNDHVSLYGPLSTGDAEVTLDFKAGKSKATVSNTVDGLAESHKFFPVDDQHVAVSFKEENNLDTVVVFNRTEAQVFYHVIAMSSDTGRLAFLQESGEEGLNLIISSFDSKTIQSIELKGHNVSFLQEPKIENAIFIGSEFKLDTAIGSFIVPLPSLI